MAEHISTKLFEPFKFILVSCGCLLLHLRSTRVVLVLFLKSVLLMMLTHEVRRFFTLMYQVGSALVS